MTDGKPVVYWSGEEIRRPVEALFGADGKPGKIGRLPKTADGFPDSESPEFAEALGIFEALMTGEWEEANRLSR